ncbi:MAG: hypothetical protein ACNYPI_01040 [Arenicellales bacterium WSBS_2016_MAG_OTU3]
MKRLLSNEFSLFAFVVGSIAIEWAIEWVGHGNKNGAGNKMMRRNRSIIQRMRDASMRLLEANGGGKNRLISVGGFLACADCVYSVAPQQIHFQSNHP